MRLHWWGVVGILLAGGSGAALWLVVSRTEPVGSMVFLFLGLLGLLLTGLTMRVVAYLNRRFAGNKWLDTDPWRIPRQAGWIGLFGALCAWLRIAGFLNLTIAVVLACVFALMEAFFTTKDR